MNRSSRGRSRGISPSAHHVATGEILRFAQDDPTVVAAYSGVLVRTARVRSFGADSTMGNVALCGYQTDPERDDPECEARRADIEKENEAIRGSHAFSRG